MTLREWVRSLISHEQVGSDQEPDPDALKTAISNEPEEFDRFCALRDLRSLLEPNEFVRFINEEGELVRDQGALGELVILDEPRELRVAALRWLSEPNYLAYVATYDNDEEIRSAARTSFNGSDVELNALGERVLPLGCPLCSSIPFRRPLLIGGPDGHGETVCERCHQIYLVVRDGPDFTLITTFTDGSSVVRHVMNCPNCGGVRTASRFEGRDYEYWGCGRDCGWGGQEEIS